MNKNRRKTLNTLQSRLDQLASLASDIRERIEQARDEEQEYLDNMPESFGGGPKGEAAAEAIEALEQAMEVLETMETEAGEGAELLETAAV